MTEPIDNHKCQYGLERRAGNWVEYEAERRRNIIPTPVCRVCGKERPSRRPRRFSHQEVANAEPKPPPVHIPEARIAANELLRRSGRSPHESVSAQGVLSALERRRMIRFRAEQALEALMRTGWISLLYRVDGARRHLERLLIADRVALFEFAYPGLRDAYAKAVRQAKKKLEEISHPVAQHVLALLESSTPERDRPELLSALAAVAQQAATGETLSLRAFSSFYLGDSKRIFAHRGTIERLLGGRLEEFGIREGEALTCVGGRGRLYIDSTVLDLATTGPFIGLSRAALLRLSRVDFPRGGLLVVENVEAFEACCNGEITDAVESLLLWSRGNLGRGARAVVEAAARDGVPVRAWADLDWYGVQIARQVYAIAPRRFRPCRMAPSDYAQVPKVGRLTEVEARLIRRDIDQNPDAPLADTLRAIAEMGQRAEQEAFLVSARPQDRIGGQRLRN